MSDRSETISVAVIDEHSFTRECITKALQEFLEIVAFAACDDCLRSHGTHDLILYHAHENVAKKYSDQCLTKFKQLLEIAPVIVLGVDSIESILAAFESGARGYIPTASTTLELAFKIIHLIKAGGTFVPPSSLSARMVSRRGAIPGAITTRELTARQIAVVERIKLGKTNKVIARELEMSESTVKVHVRNIMKKLDAKNRTEVARRAHELEMSGTRSTD
jgi:DNA-binding NarL/FixJ family response regulator